jgi:hypothetical protein
MCVHPKLSVFKLQYWHRKGEIWKQEMKVKTQAQNIFYQTKFLAIFQAKLPHHSLSGSAEIYWLTL